MSVPAVLLAIGIALVFYVLIGYPVLLAVWRPRTAPPVAKDPRFQPAVSAIVAVHNGAGFIRAKLESLLALNYPRDLLEIIVVSDASTDETESVVEEFATRGVRLVRAPRGGKASALNAAIPQASGEIIFFTDVRQPLDPEALRHLAANFADPTVGGVTGELRLLHADSGEQADMDLYWKYEVWARRQHSRIHSTFSATGCIYAMRRNLVEPLPPDTLTDDAVLTLRSIFRGYRVIFDPEAIAFDYPAVAGTEFRRRMRTLAGLWQVYLRMPKLFFGNRMWFHFLSHKFSRLALPWAVLLVFGATIALPGSSFRTFLLVSELALIFLALADYIVPAGFPLKRLSSLARTFLLMNAASLAAIVVVFVPAYRFWIPTRVKTGK